MNPDSAVAITAIVCVTALGTLWACGALADRWTAVSRYDLIVNRCSPIDSLVSNRDVMLWHCADGYRTTSTQVVDAS